MQDWRKVPKEELSRRAREEAERALQAEADLARERAKKSSDMVPKVTTGAAHVRCHPQPSMPCIVAQLALLLSQLTKR